LEQESDLAGLPTDVRETAALTAKNIGQEGKWVFTLAYPSYQPFMTYSTRRDLRHKIFVAFGSKGFRGNEFDNRELIQKIASLRYQRAKLLGYASHADFVLEERMASSPTIVRNFLDEMLQHAQQASLRDVQELADYARKTDGIEQLERWDILHYSERLKKERFDIDDELLRPYFKLENVTQGVFDIATRLFDIQFVERKDIPKYNEEVVTYEVLDKAGKHLSVLYLDFFPRPGHKKDGAWMTHFRGQYHNEAGEDVRPHVSLVCNFTKPTESKPSLLTHDEVLTLLHEFGHGLHLILSQCQYDSLAGTNVSWDFVELPSQLMENWGYAQESLNTFARHYETGEPIPTEILAKIRESRIFQEGYFTLRQLSFGLLDMAWHAQNPENITDVVSFERNAIAPTQVGLPAVEGTLTSTAFSHIFQGGYSAGYYSYKWAEVLEADAFELFEQKGVFDKATAESLRQNILSKGGSEPPMELYERFRGQKPSPKALLKKAGLV
jgi:peptidyl-dipeptidase Dcp